MARASTEKASVQLDVGWRALREAAWEDARRAFEAAVALGETPDAHEGLSWAAWWLDDAPTVFGARKRAYRLYRARDDAVGAARMATWLAADEMDFHGASAVASGWLRRAHRLLDPLEPTPAHGWLAFHEGYVAYARGDSRAARSRAVLAAELGRRFRVADLEMLGLALEGATLVARAEVREGMERLDEATAAALEGEAEIPISGAWACCLLVSACTAVLDFDRASQWCDRIAEFADRYGSRYMLAFCRTEYGAVDLWRGRWRDAERALEAAVEDFARSRPAWVGSPLVALAELRRRQGRGDEVLALLERAGPSTAAELCAARLALDRGEAVAAAEMGERLLRLLPADRRLRRAPVLELLVRARVAGGCLDAAADALDELRQVARSVGTAAQRAVADLAAGVLAAAEGEHARARELLEDAVYRFDASGAPFEAARARAELAATLAALGRSEAAGREAAIASDALASLGAAEGAGAREDPDVGVTGREREVLHLLAEGRTNPEIAATLVISEHTVHRHVSNILRKLGVPSRAAAVARAARAGLLDPDGT
jgi:LuxR family transcriptional regulator, maltose regulon positive regulatory protein